MKALRAVRLFFLLGILVSLTVQLTAQDLYFVYFEDKPQASFDPYSYFDQKAIDRRVRSGLPLYDENDLPLNPSYVQTVASLTDSVRYQLRWFNSVSIQATEAQLSQVARLPFVREIEPFGGQGAVAADTIKDVKQIRRDTLRYFQRKLLNLDLLESAGYTGKGVRIAILDAGFKEADTHPALAHVRDSGRIVGTRDFYSGRESVFNHSYHGTQVMSCVAGMYKGGQLGCGRDVEFLLARTEHRVWEKAREEDHWLAAAEWADKEGADIINSSLGYTGKRYGYADMDGKTAVVSRAAAMAAEKGILVVNSFGNEGDKKWKYMGAPADASEVLSVGACQPRMRYRLKFSSYGPNALKELKPNITAPGLMLAAGKKGEYRIIAGTSFASPLVAGYAACLMQMHPEKTITEIFELVEQTGHLYPYYDYAHGYGVPDATKLFPDSLPPVDTLMTMSYSGDTLMMAFDPERMLQDSLTLPFGRILYYHLEGPDGALLQYEYERIPNETEAFYLIKQKGLKASFRVFFEGVLYEEEWE